MVHTPLALALLFASSLAHAYYAGATPPSGWAPAIGSAQNATMRASQAAGNEAAWVGNTLRGSATVNLGGNAAKLPFAASLAKTAAPKMLAGRLAASMLGGPIGLIGLGITAAQIATDPDFQAWIGDRFTYSPATNKWAQKYDGQSTYWTVPAFMGDASVRYGSYEDACASTGYPRSQYGNNNMCGGYMFACYEHVEQTGAMREVDFSTEVLPQLQNSPIPDGLIPKIPGMDWPMNPPFVNLPPGFVIPCDDPSVCWDFKAGARPPSTYTPSGDPIPLNTDPPTFRQPYVEVTPAPTPGDPWRVDVKPKSVETNDPTPMTDPQVDPTKPKASAPGAPANPASTPKSSDVAPGLCEQFPNILACQALTPVSGVPVQNINVASPLTKDTGFGSSSGATCPATRNISLKNGSVEMSYQPYCDFATGIRPVVIAIAWLTAAATFFGFVRR